MSSYLISRFMFIIQVMNKSTISNDFNFQNQLDISNRGKDKTENYGYAFQDFPNIGNTTVNSGKYQSKMQQNISEISKKQGEGSNIIDDTSNNSMRRKYTRDQALFKSNTSNISGLSGLSGTIRGDASNISPKFVDNSKTSKSIPLSPRKEFTLRKTQKELSNIDVQKSNIEEVNNAFKKKQSPSNLLQKEYKSLQSQIRYYEEQNQKIIYESSKLQEETENLMMNFSTEGYQMQLKQFSKDIKEVNNKIEEEKQLQTQLQKMVHQLQEEYQKLVSEIKTSNFPRPAVVKDEAKIIIDEINGLKAQLQALQRDDGSLNLSQTLMEGQTQSVNKLSSVNIKNSDQIIKQRLKEISEQNQENQDPRFLINLKMACLKPQWNLFTNSQIQISSCFRDVPRVVIRFGNKLSSDLQRFSLKQNGISKLEGQIIAAQSYYQHIIEVNPSIVNELFIRIDLSYELFKVKKSIVLFVPVGMTNFGQFSPISHKQFQRDAKQEPFQLCGTFRPIDKKLISSVSQITVYMPNIIVGNDNQVCFGLFIFPFEGCELVLFIQRGEMISVSTKSQNWPLMRMLQFIFTL